MASSGRDRDPFSMIQTHSIIPYRTHINYRLINVYVYKENQNYVPSRTWAVCDQFFLFNNVVKDVENDVEIDI